MTYLSMLAVVVRVRGENFAELQHFWATRLAVTLLALFSLLCLTRNGWRERHATPSHERGDLWSVSRTLSACYGGGLWL